MEVFIYIFYIQCGLEWFYKQPGGTETDARTFKSCRVVKVLSQIDAAGEWMLVCSWG